MLQQENLIKKLKSALPNNLIITGEKYSGKKTLVNEIAPDFYWVEKSIDSIRELNGDNDYVFADLDDWNSACYSAMLKLLEENENHIIITCQNLINLPRSIISRCVVERVEPYIDIPNYCDNIGQLQFFSDELLSAVERFEYDEKFDLNVYFSVLCNYLREQISDNQAYTKAYYISCRYNAVKSLKSLNKKQFILNWQNDMRGFSNEWQRL